MSENPIEIVNTAVIEKAKSGDYSAISNIISDESAEQLITGLVGIAAQLPAQAFTAISEIYTKAIIAQERIELENIHNEAEILRKFNDQVDKAMDDLDLRDTVSVDNFTKVVSQLRANLDQEFKVRSKPNIFGKIFGRR